MKSYKGLKVSRVSGAQNTFFIANIFESQWATAYPRMTDSDRAELARLLCENESTPKTDGLLFLRPEPQFDFAWDFYNSDGSHAEMCGNAARCATYFFHEKVKSLPKMRFLTGAGEVSGEVLSLESVRVQMTEVSDTRKMIVSGEQGFFVNTGVPHFVIEKKPDAELSRRLRKVTDFGPAGSNITFVENLTEAGLQAVTFERGVEDFTQACGTGAVAAAMYLQEQKGMKNSIEVRMPGGVLKIENARTGERPFLTGPVQFEFDMELK